RHRQLRALFASGTSYALAGAAGLGFMLAHYSRPAAFLCAVAVFCLARWIARRWAGLWEPDYRAVAVEIEGRHPELHALLRTAVEQQPDPQTQQLNYLQQRVVADAVTATRRHQWLDAIPASRWVAGYAALWLGVAALVAAFCLFKPVVRPKSNAALPPPPAKDA